MKLALTAGLLETLLSFYLRILCKNITIHPNPKIPKDFLVNYTESFVILQTTK